MSNDDARRRLAMDGASKIITSIDSRKASSTDDQQSQRFKIANQIRTFYDAGFDPMIIIEMLLAGAAFVGDNHGVSRSQMQKVLGEVSIGADRQLIYTPGR